MLITQIFFDVNYTTKCYRLDEVAIGMNILKVNRFPLKFGHFKMERSKIFPGKKPFGIFV